MFTSRSGPSGLASIRARLGTLRIPTIRYFSGICFPFVSTLASLAGPAQGARLSLSFGGGGQIQRYRCTLKDGRIHAVQAPTRGRAGSPTSTPRAAMAAADAVAML